MAATCVVITKKISVPWVWLRSYLEYVQNYHSNFGQFSGLKYSKIALLLFLCSPQMKLVPSGQLIKFRSTSSTRECSLKCATREGRFYAFTAFW